jgi:phage tail sheath protein FI
MHTITGVATSIAAFIDCFKQGPMNKAVQLLSMADFEREFGGLDTNSEASYAIQQFFLTGGTEAWAVRTAPDATALIGTMNDKTGIYALEDADLFNILCIPLTAFLEETKRSAVLNAAISYCATRRALFVVDPPNGIRDVQGIKDWLGGTSLPNKENAALYFPRVQIADPLNGYRLRTFGPSGAIAGLYARIDGTRGVWKAPAGTEATLNVQALECVLTDAQSSTLDPLAINCLRTLPTYGTICWGARTLAGADQTPSDWKYVPVRRLALYLEESLDRGTKWVVFEPNDEPLWSQIRLNVGAFMHALFRQGAFQGTNPQDAYFVTCDNETTTQYDVNHGIVNILVGFAPLKLAEFIVIQIQQMAGQVRA